MILKLPRDLKIDIDSIPEDLEAQAQQCFAEYTEMTNPEMMYQDKFCFIDVTIQKLHGDCDAYDSVRKLMLDFFKNELDEFGNIPDKTDYLSVDFMEHCYISGRKNHELYS